MKVEASAKVLAFSWYVPDNWYGTNKRVVLVNEDGSGFKNTSDANRYRGLFMKYVYENFIKTRMKELVNEPRTMIFYESPHRLLKTLEELAQYLGTDRQASVSRELSKMFEETVRGTLEEIKLHFETHTLKGEIVICVAGK
jgi:hypothetical protein